MMNQEKGKEKKKKLEGKKGWKKKSRKGKGD